MTRAIWNDTVIAESDDIVTVEGNAYFPPASVNRDYLIPSYTTTQCPWKGTASYYTLRVDERDNTDAAWYYAEPKPAAAEIANRIAFWKGVQILED